MTDKVQCKAKTKSNNRCKNKGDYVFDYGYCYAHYQLWCVDKVEDYTDGKLNG